MKKKTVVKVALDILMILVIALMYNKQALGLAFHEVGGLSLIGVFFVHQGLNFQWIRRVTAKLRTADARTRVMWIVDAMMLVSFLLVGASGILISKVAFPGLAVSGGPWKSMHYGFAALSLILVGVHMGLHFNYLKGIFSRWVRLPRFAALALAAVIFAYGVYGIAATGFTRWLAMPFTAGAQGGEGPRGGGQFPGATDGENPSASEALANSASAEPAIFDTGDEASAQLSDSTGTDAALTSVGAVQGMRLDMGGDHGAQTGSAQSAIATVAQYFSIAFAFAALTTLLSLLLKRKKRQAAA